MKRALLLYCKVDGFYFERDFGNRIKWGVHKNGKIMNTRAEAYSAYFHNDIIWED